MEFQVELESICSEIESYNKMISELSNVLQSTDTAVSALSGTSWSGETEKQFMKDMKNWYTQMEQFLQDVCLVNQALSKTVNAETKKIQTISNEFVEYIK